MRPKLLYIASRWPWPVQSGRARMIDQTLAMAMTTHDVAIAAFGVPPGACGPEGISDVLELAKPPVWEMIVNLARRPLEPLQSHLFMSGDNVRILSDWVSANAPSVIMIDMVRLAGYATGLRRLSEGARVVLDMDDLLSDRYRQMRGGGGDILGSFAAGMPGPVRRVATLLPSLLLSVERRLMERAEARARTDMDAVVLVSGIEARKLSARGVGAPVFDVPPIAHPHPARPRDFSAGVRLVFFGDETYAPNAEALRIFDRLAGRFPGVRFQAAGRLDPNLRTSHVERLGFVDDLDAFLGPDAVMVAPILTGTGIKTKLLDAFSRAVPVATTAKGIEGIDLRQGHEVAIFDDERGAEAYVRRLLDSETARHEASRMGLAGHLAIGVAHAEERVRRNLVAAIGA